MIATATPAASRYGALEHGRNGIDIDSWWAYCPKGDVVVATFQIEGWSHYPSCAGTFDCVIYLQAFVHEVSDKVPAMKQAATEIQQMSIEQFWKNVDDGLVRPLSTVHA